MTIKPQATPLAGVLFVAVLIFVPLAVAQHHDHQDGHGHGKSEAAPAEHHESTAGHSHERAAVHGGAVQMTKEFHFETVFTDRGVRIYTYDMNQDPIRSRNMRGTVVIHQKGKDKTAVSALDWMAAPKGPLESARSSNASNRVDSLGFLFAEYNFTGIADGDAKVDITVKNLPGKKEEETSYRETFALTSLYGMACPIHPDQASLAAGKCSICGGMEYQPSAAIYGCCPGCPEIRATHPGKCAKCGMELTLRAVKPEDEDSTSDHGEHHH